ncbi:thioesterase II family protein [Paenibacillus faecalis]|uniref:thioesterase II family protein n=1 Tax=Paenibacillus faecalis TaxID=2079532 RepID=UPI000D10CBA7|nr:alpha/beta fold hydrolase [Paenibacillus faecalis]
MEKYKLICIPYAGGSETCYTPLKKYMDHNMNMHTVELAGRGIRAKDPFYKDIPAAVEDILENIMPYIRNEKYVLLGHSMGSILACELVYKLMDLNSPLPVMMIVSGRNPLGSIDHSKKIHDAPIHEFTEEILKIGGTNQDVFKIEELSSYFVPIMRADYRIVENYNYTEKGKKLPCKMAVFYGDDDENTDENELEQWAEYTEKSCTWRRFPGGHFFINESAEEVVKAIKEMLEE